MPTHMLQTRIECNEIEDLQYCRSFLEGTFDIHNESSGAMVKQFH